MEPKIVEFCEKPLHPNSRISGGFMVFHRRLFDRLHNDPKLIFEYAPLMGLARDGELMTFRHDGFWRAWTIAAITSTSTNSGRQATRRGEFGTNSRCEWPHDFS